ncbi:MAG: hypothetical protein JOY98_11705 [Candidatus Eremiobacteraeota bacterium]|nr:hypothetical protein [Candidatus Eremiobacteraeota bacterium]
MKRMVSCLFAVGLAIAAGSRAPAASDPLAAVRQFVDGLNTGNMASSIAACAPQTAIVDDFAPHTWTSCADWAKAFAADMKHSDDTSPALTLGKPWQDNVTGNVAYVVVPADFAYKEHGKPMVQKDNVWTFVLKRSAPGWRIVAWAWALH